MNNNYILPLLAFVVAIGIFFAYVNPTWSGPIATTKAAIASDDQALTAANQYTAQQNELTSAKNAIAPANLARLSTFLPDSVDNVGLVLDLNALAARSGLSLSNIDISANTSASSDSSDATSGALPTTTASPVSSADLSLSAIGTYPALQNFLQGVEKSTRLLDTQDIVITGSDTGVYTYKMKLRLYWLH
jgi:Tfp pilus assembly protein PilO